MTYLPIPPVSSTANAGPLADDNLVPVVQSGVTRRATLATLKAFLAASTTGATGTTGGSTGSTGGTTGSTSGGSTGTTGSGTPGFTIVPANRIGTSASTTAVKNTATTPAAVTVPAFVSRALPTNLPDVTGESPNGTTLTGASGSITAYDGTVFTLVPTASGSGAPAGTFEFLRNGASMSGRIDLEYGVGGKPASPKLDGITLAVYYYHNAYVRADFGKGDVNWFKVEGSGPDCDTEADDPRVTFLVASAVAPVGDPPYGLGTHPASVGSSIFNQWITQFKTEVGTPAYVNCFLAYDPDFTNWGNEAYTAAQSLSQDSVGKNTIPVLGIPMAKNSDYYSSANGNQGDFNAWINGTYDTYLTAAVKNYLQFFDQVDIRPGYEMNGTFMPWFWGHADDPTTNNLWLNAFKHIATTARAAATAASTTAGKTKTCLVTWNPCHQNYNSGPNPKDMYPGNDYVDYHGLDSYSPQYTQDASNWSGDGVVYSSDKSIWTVQQALNPINRIHFWDYPAAKFGIGGGNETGGTAGWGMQDAINFAKQCGKPLAFPECGTGQDFADQGKGPAEDFVFPFYLRSRCDQATAIGVPILYLNIWAADEGDGGWGFMFRQKNKAGQAWASAFGGTGAALRYNFSGTTSSGSSTGGGSTGSTSGGTTGSTGASTGSTVTGPATAVFTDTAGHTANITFDQTPPHTYYENETGLIVNVFYFLDGTTNGPRIGSSDDTQITSVAITLHGNPQIISYFANTTQS